MSPSTAQVRRRRPAGPARPACRRRPRIESGLALYASLRTVTPSPRSVQLHPPAGSRRWPRSAPAGDLLRSRPSARPPRPRRRRCRPGAGRRPAAATSTLAVGRPAARRRAAGSGSDRAGRRPGRRPTPPAPPADRRRSRTPHRGRGPLPHRPDQRVGGVEHREPIGRQGLDQLALGLGDRRLAAELAHVGLPDIEHHADLRRCDLAQVGDVADSPGPHLGDQVSGVLVDPADRQRHAELVVQSNT